MMESLEGCQKRVNNILLRWLLLYKSASQELRLRSKTVTINTNSGTTRHILSDSSLSYAIPQATETPAGTHGVQI